MRLNRIVPLMLLLGTPLAVGCGPANGGDPGSPTVVENVPITGTIFTIVFENHGTEAVFDPNNTYLSSLADQYGTADAYLANVHPSLPNYIMMTSGDTQGIGDDGPPADHPIAGTENLADQLDSGGVPWRAYMEDMGDACGLVDVNKYAARHNPFVYYTSLTADQPRCNDHVVDFDANFANDLAANTYQFMWVTPNTCNDMHDCPTSTSDEWLSRVIPQIMDSPGYKEGGAIFLLWDEGDTDATYAWSYVFHRPQNVPFILISDHLVSPAFQSNTTYGHDSYLATIEDALGLPRLATTADSTPMLDFFFQTPWTTPTLPTATTAPGTVGAGGTTPLGP